MSACHRCGAQLVVGSKFCSQCGATVSGTEMKATQPSSKTSLIKWIVGGALVIAFVALFSTYLRVLLREYHPVIEEQPEIVVPIQYGLETKTPSTTITVKVVENSIVIPVEVLKQYRLVRFTDPEGILTTPMIAYFTPEGKIVTAMSLSENCRSTDFYLQGHNIHCASCPSYWNMSSLEAYACCQRYYPDPIPSTIVENTIRIDLTVVRKWHPRS